MRKNLLVLILFVLLFGVTKQQVSAHVLQTDGTIGAVMHVDPNDDPIAEQQASFFFSFKDTTNKFTPKNCDCKIAVIENGQTIYAQPLFQNTSNPTLENASMFYTFPHPDIYQIVITGTPVTTNTFQPFKLLYTIRAEQPISASSPSTNSFTIYIGYIVGAIVLIFLTIFGLRNYKPHKKTSPKS